MVGNGFLSAVLTSEVEGHPLYTEIGDCPQVA